MTTELGQRAGELACLVRMALELAEAADNGDTGKIWKLRALLSATQLHASDLAESISKVEGATP